MLTELERARWWASGWYKKSNKYGCGYVADRHWRAVCRYAYAAGIWEKEKKEIGK